MDIALKVRVLQFHVLDADTQAVMDKLRAHGTVFHDHDSLEGQRIATVVAENIAANVIANMISMPLGFATVIVIKDKANSDFTRGADGYAASRLSCRFDLCTGPKVLWTKDTNHLFHLTDRTNESEQESVLTRNTILDITESLPVMLWRPRSGAAGQ
jgi:hypothetical protein